MLKSLRLSPDGAIDGYHYEWLPKLGKIVADPIPGVTGSDHCEIALNFTGGRWQAGEPACTPIAGADAERVSMFAEVLHLGARTSLALVKLLPFIEQDNLYRQVGGEANDPGSPSASGGVNFLFADGSVRFVSIEKTLGSFTVDGMQPLAGFWTELAQIMQLGALNENYANRGEVTERPKPGTWGEGPRLIGYSGLVDVTRRVVKDPKWAAELVGLINLAAISDREGNHLAHTWYMDEYIRQVETAVKDGTSNTILVTEAAIATFQARAIRDSMTTIPYEFISLNFE